MKTKIQLLPNKAREKLKRMKRKRQNQRKNPKSSSKVESDTTLQSFISDHCNYKTQSVDGFGLQMRMTTNIRGGN